MRTLFNEEQLMVLKEIAKDKDLVERVRWWVDQNRESIFCPMSTSLETTIYSQCCRLCYRIWPDAFAYCPCHKRKPAKEAALIILEEAKNGNQD